MKWVKNFQNENFMMGNIDNLSRYEETEELLNSVPSETYDTHTGSDTHQVRIQTRSYEIRYRLFLLYTRKLNLPFPQLKQIK